MPDPMENRYRAHEERIYAEGEAQRSYLEAYDARREAERELMRQCPLCKPSGGHYARLARHDAHVKGLPEGWVAKCVRAECWPEAHAAEAAIIRVEALCDANTPPKTPWPYTVDVVTIRAALRGTDAE